MNIKPYLPALFLIAMATQAFAVEDSLQFGRFGTVHLYQPSSHPKNVAIFVSGDGGWNLGVVDMARSLAGDGALVIGVDIVHYIGQLDQSTEDCTYPAADFEALSQYVQKKLDLPTYEYPILVGYSSGATLVYAVLVQGPPNTFAGAISMGFCPDLPLTKPLCKGSGLEWTAGPKGKGFSFLPAHHLENPWIAFQGTIDQVCNADSVESFVKTVENSRLVLLPKVGHGFSVEKNWLPQLRKEFATLNAPTGATASVKDTTRVSDLPLVELPVAQSQGDLLAVIISGDGGWAGIDKSIGEYFRAQGIPVVGLNSLKYFWTFRTPDSSGADLTRIVTYYMDKWQKNKILLVGYSRGADVLPFMTNRLSADLQKRVAGVALLGLEETINFQFHLTDWLGGSDQNGLPVKPEVEKLSALKVLCVYGSDEKHSLCQDLDTTWVTLVPMKGGHHFGGDYTAIAKRILEIVNQ